jgi:hypothetical protein
MSNISIPASPSVSSCFNTPCQDETAGVLFAQSLICFGSNQTTLFTYAANLTFQLNESCVNVSVRTVSGRVFSQTPKSPLALSFLSTNYDLIQNNPFAVVTNDQGVTVGQIQSVMIQLQVESFGMNSHSLLQVSPCVMLDEGMGQSSSRYIVYDLGIYFKDDGTIHPLRVNEIGKLSVNQGKLMICFDNFIVSVPNMSFILVQRVSDYNTLTEYSASEQNIVYASGALFCFGASLVIVSELLTTFNAPVLIIGVQSICLLLFRGIYFFLLGSGNIPIGSLLDFALIEIPTFIYIGIFLQIVFPAYEFFFNRNTTKQSPRRVILGIRIFAALLINWIIFAAIMIALAESNTSVIASSSCNCQITDPVQENQTAQIIRIVYKSFVLIIAMFAVVITLLFRTQAAKAGGLEEIYNQILSLFFGLFFDCVAFVVYYAVNSPSAYFLIALWFTELLPICMMNIVVAWETRSITIRLLE